MDNITQLSERFKQNGIIVTFEEISNIKERVFLWTEPESEKRDFIKQFLSEFQEVIAQDSFEDISKLAIVLNMEKELIGLPQWFIDKMRLVFRKNGFCISTIYARQAFKDLNVLGTYSSEDLLYFERILDEQTNKAYALKKIFDPLEAEKLLKRNIVNRYRTIQNRSYKSSALNELYGDLLNFAEETYEENKK